MRGQVEQSGRGARIARRKIRPVEFPDSGTVTEEALDVHIFTRDDVREIRFPIETTLINVSIERQIELRLMNMAAYHWDHRTDFFHLPFFKLPPGPLGQTPPEVFPYLPRRKFVAIGGARVAA